MSAPKDGGPAFPLPFILDPTRGETGMYIDGEDAGAPTGLSIRDYFAAKAMHGLLASPREPEGCGLEGVSARTVGRLAYAMADAMLTQRGK